jgi:membrane protein YdbS with pleckstrin-like domain
MNGMATDFFNDPIDIGELPRVPDEAFHPLAPGYIRAKYVGDAIAAVVVIVMGGLAVVGTRAADGPVWLPAVMAGSLLALIGVTAVLQTVSVNHLGYLVREHDVSFRRGVIARSTRTIPYNRVQHVAVDRGPVDRLFGLSTLRLRSAGGDIGIEGLTVDDANRLKDVVVNRAGMDAGQ